MHISITKENNAEKHVILSTRTSNIQYVSIYLRYSVTMDTSKPNQAHADCYLPIISSFCYDSGLRIIAYGPPESLVVLADGDFRPILSLSDLSEYVTYRHFKMEEINVVMQLKTSGA